MYEAILATNNFGDTRGPGLAGPLALLFIVLIGVALVFLGRSMGRHLRNLPREFPSAPSSLSSNTREESH